MRNDTQPKDTAGRTDLASPKTWAVFGPIDAGFGTTKDCLFPSQWALFGPLKKDEPEPDFAGMTHIPKELAVSDKRVAARNVAFPGGRLDLGALMGGKEEGKTAYLLAVVEVKKGMEIALGAGADWWMKWWVNGEVVYDTTATGNAKHPPSVQDHCFTARFKAGRNLVAVRVVSGSGSFVLAAGCPFPEPDFAGMGEPPAELTVAGRRLKGRKAAFDTAGRLDLSALLGCGGEGHTAYLAACLESDRAREVWFGAGADWRMKWWVNGEAVCDTLATGNEDRPPTGFDHRFRAQLKPGKNVLAVKVVSGVDGFALTTSGPSERERVTRRNDLTDVNAWKKCSGYYSASNRFSLEKEEAGFVIESETTQPEGPGVMSYGVITTRERHGSPGLKGTLIFEVDFVDYTNNGEYINKYMSAIGQPSDHEDPVFGLYLMGWGITIGNRKGFVGGMDDGDRRRAVQFHFDGYSKKGFFSTLCRQISTQDQQTYPRFTQTELMESGKAFFARKEPYEDWARRVMPYRSMDDATVLYSRHWPSGQGSKEGPDIVRGRFGIMLSNDGNTFSWLLDGNVMDSCDITGYFSSSTDDFADGVCISIGGGAGFRKNLWRFANPRITVRP